MPSTCTASTPTTGSDAGSRLGRGHFCHEHTSWRAAARWRPYTRGHTASHTTASPRAAAIRLRLPRGRRSPRSPRRLSPRRLVAAAVAVACFWVAYALYTEIAAGHSLDSQLHAAQEQNDALRHQIDQRKAEVAQAQTREWLMEEARKLGYVLPGEQVYVVTTPGASLPPGGGVDLKSLPSFQPSASPGSSPAPTPTPVAQRPNATPTPFVFSVPTSQPH